MKNQSLPASIPPWMLAICAMFSVQLGSALSVGMIDMLGSAGTAWLRLSMGALVFIVIARPPLRSLRRADLPPLLVLGLTTGMMTMTFLAAIDRIPLGTAVSIEFLGPLTVATLRSADRRALVWPALALTGVVLLTEPWQGEFDALGVGFAFLGAVGWGTYIVFTQKVGDRFGGIDSLSITVSIAAITAAIVGVPQAIGNITPLIMLAALGLAILLPVLPFALEMLALRKMAPSAFGTLMALEPAIGVLIGLIVLRQLPSLIQVLGVVLVVSAGAGAQRRSRRTVIDAGPSVAYQPME